MRFFSNLLSVFQRKKASKVNPAAAEIYQYGQYELGSAKNKELLQEMRGWVYSCVNAIAEELAGIEIKLFKRNGDKVEEVKEHEMLDTLYRVNDFTTKYDLFWLIGAYLELTGEAPLFLEKDSKRIIGIYFLRPDKIKPIADKKQIISGYEYDVGKLKKITLEKDEVIFFKYPNPVKPFRGIGTLEAAARSVDIDNYAEEWNKNFFKNAARPDSILTVDQPQMTEDQKNVLKKSIQDQYGGTSKAHKMAVLFGNMKLEKFAITQKDMDFLEQQKFTRDKIMGIFRVPKAIVAQTEGVNFASAKVAQYVFGRYTINPKMEKLIQQLNEFYVPMFAGSEDLFLDFVNPIPEDEEMKVKKYKEAINNWLTINEVREEEGLPPIENGDQIYLPMNLLPIGDRDVVKAVPIGRVKKVGKEKNISLERRKQIESRGRNKKLKKEVEETKKEMKKKVKYLLKEELNGEVKEKEIEWDERKKMRFWHAKEKIFIRHVKKVRDRQKRVFEEQRKEVLERLEAQKTLKAVNPSKILLDKEKEAERTIAIVLPILEEVFAEGADETFNFIGVDMTMDTTQPKIQKLLKSSCRKFSKAAAKKTNTMIKDQVKEGLRLNEGIPDMTKRINGVFSKSKVYRAERIARTETVRYNSAATQEAYEESGVVEGKQWVTELGACEFCSPLAGKIVKLKSNFFKKGDTITGRGGEKASLDYDDTTYPPLHPNCRCTIAPIYIK